MRWSVIISFLLVINQVSWVGCRPAIYGDDTNYVDYDYGINADKKGLFIPNSMINQKRGFRFPTIFKK
ncbi:hypothetical protein Trydic_g3155 [Trypoxylus dichotomus]